MAPPAALYDLNSKVLCYHGPLIYEAKVLRREFQTTDNIWEYFVHYSGWKSKWDEWVPEDRVLKYNDENLVKKKEVAEAQKKKSFSKKSKKPRSESAASPSPYRGPGKEPDSAATSRSASPTPSTSSSVTTASGGAPPQTMRKIASTKTLSTPGTVNKPPPLSQSKTKRTPKVSTSEAASAEESSTKKEKERIQQETTEQTADRELKVSLPLPLKEALVDDWDYINRHDKLVTLPTSPSVSDILDLYVEHERNRGRRNEYELHGIEEIATGLKEYFDLMLGSQLLYKFERVQYMDFKNSEDKKAPQDRLVPSKVYGFAHLARLFTRMGSLSLTEGSAEALEKHFQEIVLWLAEEHKKFFQPSKYEYAPPEYHRHYNS
ncbi:unnamed protein product [Cyprideis torosa]|uniref:Uncharacterized protein n=1 Tax=Cyprideis torosa TaxID=163714 RepID=A0A7R8W3Y0_9CRUS|nr:unnamed protein product [Cyprideis torosa]CAG0881359.1 unnamed protein product [Cyprideis torosa]